MKAFALLAPVAMTAVFVIGGCNSTAKTESAAPKANMGMVNSTCPFSGKAASADHTADYSGQKVGFCCDGCVKKFNKADEAGKAALMSKAK